MGCRLLVADQELAVLVGRELVSVLRLVSGRSALAWVDSSGDVVVASRASVGSLIP